jgi:hypothetical protein
LFHFGKEVGAFQVGCEKFNKNLTQGPDIAPEIEGALVGDIRMATQESLKHRARTVQLRVKESEKLVVDLDLKPFPLAVGRDNIVKNEMGNKVALLVEQRKGRGHLME